MTLTKNFSAKEMAAGMKPEASWKTISTCQKLLSITATHHMICDMTMMPHIFNTQQAML
jgi:hypothetical protein